MKKKRPDNSKLRKWLKDKGFLAVGKDTREVTHLLMNGGKVCLPRSETLSFFHAYVSSTSAGEAIYVVESRTKIFRFLCDLDFYEQVPGEDPRQVVGDCIRCIQTTLKEFYPYKSAGDMVLIVCKRDDAETPRGTSRGVHLVWPNILVNSDIGLNLREAIVARLHAIDPDQPWDAIVDESVYIGNGLRMVGSRKMAKCSECGSKKGITTDNECMICDGTGNMDIGRVYAPVMTLDGDGDMVDTETDPIALQMSTSVRTVEEINNPDAVTCPFWFNSGRLFDMNDKKERQRVKKKRAREKVSVTADDEEKEEEKPAKKKKPLDGIPEDDKRFIAACNFIKKKFASRCGDKAFKITKMVTDSREGHPSGVYFCNTDCTYCENKGKNHNNSTIYFVITPKDVRLKCHCPCPPTISGSMACSEYSGKPVPISTQLRNKLFKKPPCISGSDSNSVALTIPGKSSFPFSEGWKNDDEKQQGLQVIENVLLKLAESH